MRETTETKASLPDLSRVPLTRPEPENCGRCRFYVPTTADGKVGKCVRNPPAPLMVGMAQGLAGQPVPVVDGFFPPTNVTVWCGRFEERTEPLPVADFQTVGEAQ